jgi:hypothetical protein
MNLMGAIGSDYFAFSLNSRTPVCALVEQSRDVALSSIPMEKTQLAFRLGTNHRKDCIDLSQLEFATEESNRFALRVPSFSLRVRELTVNTARKLGSHTLFVARILEDQHRNDGLECFVVHGTYQAWKSHHNVISC